MTFPVEINGMGQSMNVQSGSEELLSVIKEERIVVWTVFSSIWVKKLRH